MTILIITTMAKTTQKMLEKLEQEAEQIGRWALYVLQETEYWDPLSLDELTQEKLEEIQQRAADWLTDNRADYPPSGAEEELRSMLTQEVRRHPWAVDEDTAFQLEYDRSEKSIPIEEQTADLERLRDLYEYPLDPEQMRREVIAEKALNGERLQKRELEFVGY
jgi:hypothetical protein